MAGMEGLAAGILSLWHMTIQNDHHVYENLRLYDIYVSKYMLVFCRSQRGNWVRRLKLKFSGKFTTLMPKIRIIQFISPNVEVSIMGVPQIHPF